MLRQETLEAGKKFDPFAWRLALLSLDLLNENLNSKHQAMHQWWISENITISAYYLSGNSLLSSNNRLNSLLHLKNVSSVINFFLFFVFAQVFRYLNYKIYCRGPVVLWEWDLIETKYIW